MYLKKVFITRILRCSVILYDYTSEGFWHLHYVTHLDVFLCLRVQYVELLKHRTFCLKQSIHKNTETLKWWDTKALILCKKTQKTDMMLQQSELVKSSQYSVIYYYHTFASVQKHCLQSHKVNFFICPCKNKQD